MMKCSPKILFACAFFGFSLSARGTLGQTTARDIADAEFKAGVEAAQAGAVDVAIHHFESAYRTSPHFSVLYNLGLAYEAAGQPVEAVDAFSRYLEQAGGMIGAARRSEVNDAIKLNQKRIGELVLVVSPNSAEVVIDGRPIPPVLLRKPIRLAAGVHGLVLRAPGLVTETRSIVVGSEKRVEIQVTLQSVLSLVPAERASANPQCTVSVAKGPKDDQLALLQFNYDRLVDLRAQEARSRATWAWIAGGTGLALGAASIVLFAIHSRNVSHWEQEGRELDAMKPAGAPPNPTLLQQAFAHKNEAVAIQSMEDAAIGTAVGGVGALATWALLYFGNRATSLPPPSMTLSPTR